MEVFNSCFPLTVHESCQGDVPLLFAEADGYRGDAIDAVCHAVGIHLATSDTQSEVLRFGMQIVDVKASDETSFLLRFQNIPTQISTCTCRRTHAHSQVQLSSYLPASFGKAFLLVQETCT